MFHYWHPSLCSCQLPVNSAFWLRNFTMPIWSDIYIVYSRYFIFCRYLNYNEIASIQSGTFNGIHHYVHVNYRLIFTHWDTSWEKKKDGTTINIKRPHQYSFMTHSQLMKIIKRIYNWRSTLSKKRKPLVQYLIELKPKHTNNTDSSASWHLSPWT
jgi:hypothetical protein